MARGSFDNQIDRNFTRMGRRVLSAEKDYHMVRFVWNGTILLLVISY